MPEPFRIPGIAAPRTWHNAGSGHLSDGFDRDPRVRPTPSLHKPRRLQSLFGRMQAPGPVPYISQLGQGSWNDESNCGPTVMAMAGRACGVIPVSDSDRNSIEAAGRLGDTRASGTSPFGLAKIADGMGLDFQQIYGVNPGRIARFLEQGALVVVKGNAFAVPWHNEPDKFSGHVMLVIGQDDQGNFLVNDPYDDGKQTRSMSPAEHERFGKPRDFRDKSFSMAVGRLTGPVFCREVLPGVARF